MMVVPSRRRAIYGLALILSLGALLAGACGGSGGGRGDVEPAQEPAAVAARPEVDEQAAADEQAAEPAPAPADNDTLDMGAPGPDSAELSMGEAALGGQSITRAIARDLLASVPAEGAAWVAYAIEMAPGVSVTVEHEAAFLYAVEGTVQVETGGIEQSLQTAAGTFIQEGESARVTAGPAGAVIWDIRLAPADGQAPTPDARLVFVSEPLHDIPPAPLVILAEVIVPSGGLTVVHTHPGPEFIYVTSGVIDYQNANKLSEGVGVGTAETIGANVAVQKRNPYPQEAAFLSLFLLDAAQEFATPARFGDADADAAGERNLAAAAEGARISGVSSNFGGGTNDAVWGAASAIDGDASTQWSSDGDGNDAWIEIELPVRTRVRRIGFWTRTMQASAQIRTFQIVTDEGETVGPFTLRGPAAIEYFDTDFTATRFRFEAVGSSGGNTGAVEVEVYGAGAP